jgi:hypothetical protein
MQPSYIICKFCGTPVWGPSDDEDALRAKLLALRLSSFRCPNCGMHKFIRKVAFKV